MFEIIHHGATNGVTGSCHELSLPNGSVLVDCGLFQGSEAEDKAANAEEANLLAIDFPINRVKALIVTHCHIDHVGRIPYLLAAGFKGPIYATEATAYLLPLVIEDAIKVGVTRDASIIDAVLSMLKEQLVAVPYKTWFNLGALRHEGKPVQAKFQRAGHILGSAYVEVNVPLPSDLTGINRGGRNKRHHRVIFSGDLGAPYSPLLPAPQPPYECDTLVLESTYGDKNHENRANRRERLQQLVEKCFEDRGTVLIPAFSIGRTQELLYEIEQIIFEHEQTYHAEGRVSAAGDSHRTEICWDNLDIIVDSPLASKFTESYRQLKDLWDAEAKQKVRAGRHPLSFEQLLTIDSHQDHLNTVEYLRKTGRPAIVLAASGMCTGGRIVNYLKELLPDSRTDVVLVGYQAAGTAGRDIQTYGPKGGYVMLEGQRVDIKAGVHTLGGYSAHADQKDLLNFVRRMRNRPTDIRLVHGDSAAKLALKAKLEELLPEAEILIP